MDPQTRALPEGDLAAILGVSVVLHGLLLTDQLPTHVIQRLVRRLIDHGPLPPGASEADLSLLFHDLAQRLHWAMGHGEDYPAATPYQTTYCIDLPSDSAAESCRAELAEMGARDVATFAPGDRDRRMTSSDHVAAGLDWQLAASFSDVPPSAAFKMREKALSALAERHGGRFAGSLIG